MQLKLKINTEISRSPFSHSHSETDPLETQIAIAVFNQKSLSGAFLSLIVEYSLKAKNTLESCT